MQLCLLEGVTYEQKEHELGAEGISDREYEDMMLLDNATSIKSEPLLVPGKGCPGEHTPDNKLLVPLEVLFEPHLAPDQGSRPVSPHVLLPRHAMSCITKSSGILFTCQLLQAWHTMRGGKTLGHQMQCPRSPGSSFAAVHLYTFTGNQLRRGLRSVAA